MVPFVTCHRPFVTCRRPFLTRHRCFVTCHRPFWHVICPSWHISFLVQQWCWLLGVGINWGQEHRHDCSLACLTYFHVEAHTKMDIKYSSKYIRKKVVDWTVQILDLSFQYLKQDLYSYWCLIRTNYIRKHVMTQRSRNTCWLLIDKTTEIQGK